MTSEATLAHRAAYQAALDTRALEIATQAMQRQADHEATCTARWGIAMSLLKGTLATVIMTLISVVSAMAMFLLNHVQFIPPLPPVH